MYIRNPGIGLFLIIRITYVIIYTDCAYSVPNVHMKEEVRLWTETITKKGNWPDSSENLVQHFTVHFQIQAA